MGEIWFWQRIVSPHMAGLASALARKGVQVHYVAEHAMSADRVRLGWQVPGMEGVQQHFIQGSRAVESLVAGAAPDSVHICQGMRANGYVARAQRALAKRGLQQWVVMETVDDSGMLGVIKRLEYRRLFRARRKRIAGVLATGHRTQGWVRARGMPGDQVFPFAYFLPDIAAHVGAEPEQTGPFRFIFVGSLIELKRVGLLLTALARIDSKEFKLDVIGVGPLDPELRRMADHLLPGRVRWLGRVPSSEVSDAIRQVDCLVLPVATTVGVLWCLKHCW
jgi:glycosyltransferase involved in cell wall biosynthesis